jgi:HEAT repeat protein
MLARWLGDDTMREPAADALRSLGIAALPHVTRVLVRPRIVAGREPPSWIDGRVAAAAIVGTIGGDAAELPLVWSLADATPSVRHAAALSLYANNPAAAEVVGAVVIEELGSESWLDRDSAAAALRAMGSSIRAPLALALPALPRDGAVAAIAILAELGEVAALGALHAHRDDHVRWAAVDALAKLRTPEARSERVRFARDRDPAIRKRART